MNLFIAGFNTPEIYFEKVLNSLSNTLKVFPNLIGGNKFEFKSNDSKSFLLTMNSGEEKKEIRNYVSEDKDYIAVYTGVPLDPANKIRTGLAEHILKNFESIKYSFEGQASILRITKNNFNADIITDTLGMQQVYYYYKDGQLLISNHVVLIERAADCNKLDLTGAAYFLSIGWVAGNNTLKKDIKLIRGGKHWKWNGTKKTLTITTYFDPSEIKPNSKEILTKDSIEHIYNEFQNYLFLLSENFNLECPLTGGYDSRLVAALLLHKGIEAKYYTAGNPEHNDVRTAAKIAKMFNLNYRLYETDHDYLFSNWENLVKGFVLQNNGMASLWQIFNILTHLDKTKSNNYLGSDLRLTTHGAEIARLAYNRPFLWRRNIYQKDVYNYLTQARLVNQGMLLSRISIEIFYGYFTSFFKEYTEKGIDFRLIPDLFYTFERVGRFMANHWWVNINDAKIFSLFCTKTYLRAALKIHPLDKITYPIHRRILKTLNPLLFKVQFLDGAWPIKYRRAKIFMDTSKPILKKYLKRKNINKTKVSKTEKGKVSIYGWQRMMSAKINNIRSICLDQSSSELWQLINRNRFEEILKGNIESRFVPQILAAATLFYYEHFSKE